MITMFLVRLTNNIRKQAKTDDIKQETSMLNASDKANEIKVMLIRSQQGCLLWQGEKRK